MAIPNITDGLNRLKDEDLGDFLLDSQETLGELESRLLAARNRPGLIKENFDPFLALIEKIRSMILDIKSHLQGN